MERGMGPSHHPRPYLSQLTNLVVAAEVSPPMSPSSFCPVGAQEQQGQPLSNQPGEMVRLCFPNTPNWNFLQPITYSCTRLQFGGAAGRAGVDFPWCCSCWSHRAQAKQVVKAPAC